MGWRFRVHKGLCSDPAGLLGSLLSTGSSLTSVLACTSILCLWLSAELSTTPQSCPTSSQGEALRKTKRPWKNLRNSYSVWDSDGKTCLCQRSEVRARMSMPLSLSPMTVCLQLMSVWVPSVSSLCLVLLSLTCYFISLHVPRVPLWYPHSVPQCHP